MTDEVKALLEGQQEQEPEQKQSEPSPVEQEAMEQGWVPREEFQGEEHKWVEAGEFLRRGELIQKISHQSHELKEVRKALTEFKNHYSKVKETEYNRALATLKAEYKSANREGDFELADRLETEIASVEKEAATIKQDIAQVQQAQTHPEFVAWVTKNDWYNTQKHMRIYADDVGATLAQQGVPPSEVLKKVEAAVKAEFPTKFTNPNRDRPSAVEGASTKAPAKKESFELTDQERRIMNNLVASKVLTKEEYIADLRKQKGIA